MTTYDHHPEYELDHHPEYELTQLAVFGVAAIVLLVFAWTFGTFVR
ncbi:MAG: hypothetical protein WCB75_22260 [Pseudolabrys sp.]|jgi:hypothetical protein